jgi:hypothetical protein
MADIIDYSTVEEVVEVVKAERDSADYGKNRIAVFYNQRTPVVRNGFKLHFPSCTVIIGDTHHRLVRQTGPKGAGTEPVTLARALQELLPSLQKPSHSYKGKSPANFEETRYETGTKKGFERVDFVDFNTIEVK